MPYSIKTKDGIVINNIPDNVAPDSDELKQRVAQLRGQELPAPVEGQGFESVQEAAITAQAEPPPSEPFLERSTEGMVMTPAGPVRADAAFRLPQETENTIIRAMNTVSRNFNRGVGRATGLAPVMGALGAFPGGTQAETPVERGIEAAGEAAGLLNVAGAAAKYALQGMQRTGRFLGDPSTTSMLENALGNFFKTAVRNPAQVQGFEAAAAFTAGSFGESLAQSEGEEYRIAGEILGGVAPGAAMAAPAAVSKYAPVATMVRTAVRMARPPEASGSAMDIAAGRLQRAVPLGERALRGEEGLLPEARDVMTTAERAGDPGLLNLEKYLLSNATKAEGLDQLQTQAKERLSTINTIIRDSAGALPQQGMQQGQRADPTVAREYLDGLVNASIEQARANTASAISSLPNAGRRDLNIAAKNQLESAYRAARGTESELWSAVPSGIRTKADSASETVRTLIEEMAQSRVKKKTKKLPPMIRQFLGDMKKNKETGKMEFKPGSFARGRGASVQELVDLRSELGRMAREELGATAPNRDFARRLLMISDSLLDDLARVESADPDLQIARQFSADMNDRFTRGIVGRVLGNDMTGAERIPAALTLETLLSQGTGRRVEENARSILSAVNFKLSEGVSAGNPADMNRMMGDLLLDDFRRATTKQGDFSLSAANNFLANRQDILSLFPEQAQRINAAIQAKNAQIAAEGIINPQKSAAGVVLGATPGREVKRLFDSNRAAEATDAVMKMLTGDSKAAQEAVAGFRQSVVDEIVGQATGTNGVVSGARLGEVLKNDNVKKVVVRALTKEQRSRLAQIQNTAGRLDQIRAAAPSPEGLVGETEPMLVEFSRQFASAALGRRAAAATGSTGTVQIPGMFVKFSNRLVDRGLDPARELIKSAILSPSDDLLRNLLSRKVRIKFDDPEYQVMRSWMLSSAYEHGIDINDLLEEEQNQGSTLVDPEPPL